MSIVQHSPNILLDHYTLKSNAKRVVELLSVLSLSLSSAARWSAIFYLDFSSAHRDSANLISS